MKTLCFQMRCFMLNSFFKLDENNTNVKTEILAGITTFLAMAYILGVNPTMLADGGMPVTGVFFATAVASGIACILMGLIANWPVGLAPGMGLNALFTYTIILGMGCSWEAALCAVVLSSIIFLIITISGLREAILNIIPIDLKLGIGAAIGFFLAFLGLKGAGIIIADPSTFVTLGSMTSAPALLALIGILITLILYVRKVPASVFIGLIVTAIIGVIFTAVGFGTGDLTMPAMPAEFVSLNFDTSLFGAFYTGFGELFTNIPNLLMMLFSLVFVTFFDTTGTLLGIANQAGYVDDEGNVEGVEKPFLVDALSGVIGSIFGTSTLTAYVESATGVGLGGRTGLTAIVTGLCFLVSVIFAPAVLSLFTSSVTAAALVMVGILMIMQLKDVEWENLVVAASVFMTIIMMILTYSISLGIAWGFVVYAVASLASGKSKDLSWGIWVMVLVFLIYLFFGL